MKINRLLIFTLALATALSSANGNLRSIEDINSFIKEAKPSRTSFKITGNVLSVSLLPEANEIILLSDSGIRMQFYRSLGLSLPSPGDKISANGITKITNNHESYNRIDSFKVVERNALPEPIVVKLSETSTEDHHLQTITTAGTVIDAFPDEIDRRYTILLLKDKNKVVPVSLLRETFGDRSDLVDATIRVTGIYRRSVCGVRKFSWPSITPRFKKDIEILTPPPKDIFEAPTLENRPYLTSEEIIHMSKRSIAGEVLATWSGEWVMLRVEDSRIVKLKLAHGETLPPCGSTILAVGQPETDLFHINLTAARWKNATLQRKSKIVETPKSSDEVFWNKNDCISIKGEAYGELITAEGIVRTLPQPDSKECRFIIDTENSSLYIDASSCKDIISKLQIGSTVQVTGRCILLTNAGARDYSSAKIDGVAIVIRNPNDIVILKHPSWWTLRKLTIVISLLLAFLVGIYIWNRILRNLATRRGRELYREQVAHAIAEFKTDERTRLAVELHDFLSQTLAGIACHLAVGAEALDSNPTAAKKFLATARKMLNSCRSELKQCLFDLRSNTLEEPDFSTAIRNTLEQIDSCANVQIKFDVPRRILKDTSAHAILSIIRELTGNAIRHGNATEIKISGRINESEIIFSVADNGSGFDPLNCDGPTKGHFGLEGIRNRLEKLNGVLTIKSSADTGTIASVSIPLPSAKSQESKKQ